MTTSLPGRIIVETLKDAQSLFTLTRTNLERLDAAVSQAAGDTDAATRVQFFVDSTGNDTTGNGSPVKPFLTVAAALLAVTAGITAADGDPYYATVNVGPGTFDGSTPLTFTLTNAGALNLVIRGSGPGRGGSSVIPSLAFTSGTGAGAVNVALRDLAIAAQGAATETLALGKAAGSGNVTYFLDNVSVQGDAVKTKVIATTTGAGGGTTTVYITRSEATTPSTGSGVVAITALDVIAGVTVNVSNSDFTGRRAAAVAVATTNNFKAAGSTFSVVNGAGAAAGNIDAITGAGVANITLTDCIITPLADGNPVKHNGTYSSPNGLVLVSNITVLGGGAGTLNIGNAHGAVDRVATDAGVPVSITIGSPANVAYYTGAAQVGFTAATSGDWATSVPTTLHEAVNRLSAVVGDSVPIPTL